MFRCAGCLEVVCVTGEELQKLGDGLGVVRSSWIDCLLGKAVFVGGRRMVQSFGGCLVMRSLAPSHVL